MSHARRVPVVLLAAALVALGLVGQAAAVSPARAAQDPAPATAGASSEQAATPALETRRAAALTLEAPLAAPAVQPAVPPSTRDGWSVLMTEGFEGVFPSPGWAAFDDDGATNGEYFWAPDDYKPHTPSTKSAWPGKGGANGVDPNSYYYPPNMRSWMVYGPFDLSGRTQANLDFWYWNQSESNYDWFFWGQSGDGTDYDGTQVSGDSVVWQHVTLDLSASLGDASVYVAFVFNSDGSNYDDGPFVDDVTLSALSGATTPPGAFSKTAPANVAAGVALNPTLSWGASTGATSYEYCYDTSNDSACSTWTSTGTTTSANLAGLGMSTTYYWQVRAKNGAGTTYADGASTTYWSFTTTNVPVTRDWTYMVYLDGDNNLESAAVNDFLEMSSVGSTSRVAVVAQMDRITGWDTTYDNWTDTRRFYITAGMTPAINGTSIGEVNMGDPNTLVAFVQWAQATYPAGRYALILWDHGSGWRSRALDDPLTQGIAYDDTSGGDGLSMVELRSALNTLTGGGANPFDLIGMDACLMALIEVDNQLRPYADVRVTSQEVEPNDGAPQDAILAALVANPAITTEALATVYVDEYYASHASGFTQSAADLGTDYGALNTAVNNFAATLLANGAANAAGIQAARTAVQDFDFDYYIDLYDFASRVSANVANTAIDNAAAAVMAALGPATIHEHHGAAWPGAHGLSIYFPKTLGEYDTRYDGTSGFLQFTAATQWDEWLRAYYGYAAGGAPANDGFGSAIVIGAVPYTNTQSVEGATTATDDPAFSCWPGVGPKNRTVWYRYTAPSAQTLIVDTLGSNYDTVLGVWTGSQGSLVNVGCSDDAAPGFSHSRLEFAGSAGTTYYIEAADYYNPSATSQLTVNLATASPPGAFGKVAPANGATGVALSPTLSWQALGSALWYGYCYDTTDDDACDSISWTDNGTATSAVLSGLSPNTTYYWQVFASTSGLPVDADGDTWWSFTTGAPVLQEMTFRSVAAYDGWVLEENESSGKGGTFDAAATTARVGDDASDRQWRSILHFDTSLLPDGAVVTGVTLRVKRQAMVGGNPFDSLGYLTVDQKTGAYHEIAALEKLDFHAVGSRGNVGRFIKTPAEGWYRAPLRSPSYPLVNLAGSTQFRLRFATDDNDNGVADYLSFYTGNAPEADRPQLIVTYYVP